MIYGWMHVGKCGPWEQVYQDQMAVLAASGLLDATEQVFTGYAEGANFRLGENPTLSSMWDWARENLGHKVWYIHTKGVSHPCAEVAGSPAWCWRKYMEYFVVERWRDCVAALDDFEACGVDWMEEDDLWAEEAYGIALRPQLFAGNFWWATTDLISRIDPTAVKTWGNRYASEYDFLSTANPKAKCFHKSYVNLYTEAYTPDRYRLEETDGTD